MEKDEGAPAAEVSVACLAWVEGACESRAADEGDMGEGTGALEEVGVGARMGALVQVSP